MNPLTNMKNVKKLSEQELKNNWKTSWHDQYKDSAWIFVGGLPYDLTEGDVICVFSQYGEVVNLNLVRDKSSGKSKGYCFICYEDQRSTTLAVDNLNGIKILGRIIRVDHVADYKAPKDMNKISKEMRKLRNEGCAVTPMVKVKDEPPDHHYVVKPIKIDKSVPMKKEKEEYKEGRKRKKSERGHKEKKKHSKKADRQENKKIKKRQSRSSSCSESE